MPWVGCGGGGNRGGGGGGGDYQWRPRTVEDSIDPGVHPAVAAMRKRAAETPRTVEDAIVGRRVCHVIGQNKAPQIDLARTLNDPSYNPLNFFRQAGKLGVNPLHNVTSATMPELPSSSSSSKEKKGEEDGKEKKGRDKKKKDKKKEKKKKEKKEKKKKHKKKKKKDSSSSSTSSSASSSSSSSSTPSAKKRKH